MRATREKTSWIALDRNILSWRWYKDVATKSLFLHLLLKANVTDHGFKDQTIFRGELATSIASLSDETGLSQKQVRTALRHLVSTGEITKRAIKGHGGFTVISIARYDFYQSQTANKGQIKGEQRASKGHLKGEDITGIQGEQGDRGTTRARRGPSSGSSYTRNLELIRQMIAEEDDEEEDAE